MAGLVAAVRARELGAQPVVYETGDRPGGSMCLSSCVVWRHRSLDLFRDECPGGDPGLQRLIVDRLDDALDWLESMGAPALERETGNPLTIGRRFDPAALTDALARRAGGLRLGEPLPAETDGPLVLATGGFHASRELVARHIAPAAPLPLRGNPWSTGAGLETGLARGAAPSAGMNEFYGRAMPDVELEPRDYVRLSQLYGRSARVVDEDGVAFFEREPSWSENDLAQAIARRPGAAAWFLLDRGALAQPTRYGTVAELVEQARAAGGTVLPADELPFARSGEAVAVRVRTAITHTIGGLRVDTRARALREDGSPVEGLWAAGVDAGGIATGGYASGLAQALVLGLAAAEDAVELS
jgi:succinate dehydrogenase/fumarate reductase flavoprotein subunit